MNEIIENNENDELQKQFYIAYNDSYKLYLNHIHPTIFMNVFLEKIITLTKSVSGYIVSVHKSSDGKIVNIEALYNKIKSNDDSILIKNSILHIDPKSICMKAIDSENIQIINDVSQLDVTNEPIKFSHDYKSFICIPYKFNDVVIGVLGLTNFGYYENKNICVLKILGNLIANLQNNYFAFKISNLICTENKIVIYQLMDDILNTTQDAIILVDTNYNFIYSNSRAEILINDLYGDFLKSTQKKKFNSTISTIK